MSAVCLRKCVLVTTRCSLPAQDINQSPRELRPSIPNAPTVVFPSSVVREPTCALKSPVIIVCRLSFVAAALMVESMS